MHNVAAMISTLVWTALTELATGAVVTPRAHLAVSGGAICRSRRSRRRAGVDAASQCTLQGHMKLAQGALGMSAELMWQQSHRVGKQVHLVWGGSCSFRGKHQGCTGLPSLRDGLRSV